MAHFGKLMVAALGVLGLIAAGSATALANERHGVLQFDSMVGVHGAAVGTVNHRGITGGGLPWVIASGRGEVDRNGEVTVRVKGLVIPVAPFNGTNPAPTFGAVVSCVTSGHVIVNVSTVQFLANTTGDSTIDGMVSLPHPCNHPIVFVVGPNGAWFSRSSAGEDEGGDG
jgi:hypothetical protein